MRQEITYFFACPYSFTVWESLVRGFFGRRTDPDWTETMKMVAGHRHNRLDSILLKMVFQMTIYHAWRERNGRRHQMPWKSADQLHRIIDKMMSNRISSLKYTGQHRNAGLMQRWFEISG